MIRLLLLCVLTANVLGFSQCSNTSYPYSGKTVTMQLTKAANVGSGGPISVSGTITINNGCQFTLSDFIFSGVTSGTWF